MERLRQGHQTTVKGQQCSTPVSADTELVRSVLLYCSNITVYGVKAKDLLGVRLVEESSDERVIVVCLQEPHLYLDESNQEADHLLKFGWKSCWNTGRVRESAAGNSPGTVICSAGAFVDHTINVGGTPIGHAKVATPWECEDCLFAILHLQGCKI